MVRFSENKSDSPPNVIENEDVEEISDMVHSSEIESVSPPNVVETKDATFKEPGTTAKDIQNRPQDSLSVVYATAMLENSPYNQVTKTNIESISQIIDSKEHLQRNIENFRFGNISSWGLSNGKYNHQCYSSS
jgi:hypothetical protein